MINIRDKGALGDGVTDDWAAIMAALDDAGPGGAVMVPPGCYAVGQTVKPLYQGQRIIGEGGGCQTFEADPAADVGSVLKWIGALGGDVVAFAPIDAVKSLAGCEIEHIGINGNNLAKRGLSLRSANNCRVDRVSIRHMNPADGAAAALHLGVIPEFPNGVWTMDCAFRDGIIVVDGAANGILCDGNWPQAGSHSAFCKFDHWHITHKNGAGVLALDMDDNDFANIALSRIPSGNGPAIDLGQHATSNWFRQICAGSGSGNPFIVARAGSARNSFSGLSSQDQTTQVVIEPGADIEGVGGFFYPELRFGGSAAGVAYAWRGCWWQRKGSTVSFQLSFALTSKGAAAAGAPATITGLPFPGKQYSYGLLNPPKMTGMAAGLTQAGAQIAALANAIGLLKGPLLGQTMTAGDFTNTSTVFLAGSYET